MSARPKVVIRTKAAVLKMLGKLSLYSRVRAAVGNSGPQRFIFGLKQTLTCLRIILHTNYQTTNFLKSTKSVPTQFRKNKTYTHKHQTQNFGRISPVGIVPVKKVLEARICWFRGPFRGSF